MTILDPNMISESRAALEKIVKVTGTAELNMASRNDEKKVQKLLRQQEALAHFGGYAFREKSLHAVLTEAARVCAEGMDVPYCKVLRHRHEEDDLVVEAGVGWNKDVVGHALSKADASSPDGRAFVTRKPVIAEDLRKPHDFQLPPLYVEHDIVSTMNVVIQSNGEPYGVLEIDSPQPRAFDQDDIHFLTGFANVLAEAVRSVRRFEALGTSNTQKDAALAQRDVLSRELQHRVRNNLQLVYHLLNRLAGQTQDADAKRGFADVARRVLTLGTVYDHLLGVGMSRTINFGEYLKSLCAGIAEFHEIQSPGIKLTWDSIDSLSLDLDRATAFGIVVNELVANSYEHAFPNATGKIAVNLRHDSQDQPSILSIGDDGSGLVEAAVKGLGIGLVRRLVQQAGGSVNVESSGGTRWLIAIPPAN